MRNTWGLIRNNICKALLYIAMIKYYSILHARQQAIFNSIAFILVLVVNYMANTLKLNGKTTGEISAMYPNMFVPAPITFSIWGLIYLWLLVYIIYQLWLAFSKGHTEELQSHMLRMRAWFLITCLGNIAWLFSWHFQLIEVSVIMMCLILYALLKIHRNFRIALPVESKRETWWVQVPFSLYLGWISIALLANITALLVSIGFQSSGTVAATWAIAMVLVGTLAGVFMVIYRHNVVHALVGIWAIYGISIQQFGEKSPGSFAVFAACIISITVLFLSVLVHFLARKPRNFKI
ncbi:hypothetical protein COR50_16305 [Chitinophaga caeni]|uniref:Lantibiotic ABC transporter permease n=2 Tax=Chitinophaga caeni TaxID=2029983 RepID=A0A291QX42_9BACT|nr:hypothetical protein COR50_16305 [Chitinophaga caeni]